MEGQFENRNLKLENCDIPPPKNHFFRKPNLPPQLPQCQPLVSNRSSIGPSARGPSTEGVLRHGGVPRQSSIGTLARGPRLQGVQCHPRVPKHHPTDLKPVSPQYSSRSSARGPCLQCPQCHPRVSKHLPTDLKPLSPQYSSRSSPRRPCLQCPQCHPRVPNRSSIDPSAREPCLQASHRQIALRGEANLTSPSKRICPKPIWNGVRLARCYARGPARQPTPASVTYNRPTTGLQPASD